MTVAWAICDHASGIIESRDDATAARYCSQVLMLQEGFASKVFFHAA